MSEDTLRIMRLPSGVGRPVPKKATIEAFVLYECEYTQNTRRKFAIGVFSSLDLAARTVWRRVMDNRQEMAFAYGKEELDRLFSCEAVSSYYEATRFHLDRELGDDGEYYYFKCYGVEEGCDWFVKTYPDPPKELVEELATKYPQARPMISATLSCIMSQGVTGPDLKEVAEFRLSRRYI